MSLISRGRDGHDANDADISSGYCDPNKTPPDNLPSRNPLKRLFQRLRPTRDGSVKLQKSLIPLTERNLTEFGNPEYNDEHDAFHPVRRSRKVSISKWLHQLP
jgi:hypothetical protein